MTLLKKVRWINLPSNSDARGTLTAIESGQDIPFELKRIFYVYHLRANRGGHANSETDQVVIAAAGSFKLCLSDGRQWRTYSMNEPGKGLYIPRMVFVEIKDLSPDAVYLVLANTHYDMAKTIRTWENYLKVVKSLPVQGR